jgi:CPA2 family monovalent cation:H+ antiporter-2
MQALHQYGVYEVVQPEFEAGLEITRQALLHLSIPATEIQKFTDTIRHELYAPLYQTYTEYQTITQLKSASRLLELSWVHLGDDCPLPGQSVRALNIRRTTGATIVGIMRHGQLQPNPPPEYVFTPGDWLAVLGNPEQLAAFQVLAAPSLQD